MRVMGQLCVFAGAMPPCAVTAQPVGALPAAAGTPASGRDEFLLNPPKASSMVADGRGRPRKGAFDIACEVVTPAPPDDGQRGGKVVDSGAEEAKRFIDALVHKPSDGATKPPPPPVKVSSDEEPDSRTDRFRQTYDPLRPLMGRKQWDAAERALRPLLAMDLHKKDRFRVICDIARCLCVMGRHGEAIAILDGEIDIYPWSASLRRARAETLLKKARKLKKNPKECAAILRRASDLAPKIMARRPKRRPPRPARPKGRKTVDGALNPASPRRRDRNTPPRNGYERIGKIGGMDLEIRTTQSGRSMHVDVRIDGEDMGHAIFRKKGAGYESRENRLRDEMKGGRPISQKAVLQRIENHLSRPQAKIAATGIGDIKVKVMPAGDSPGRRKPRGGVKDGDGKPPTEIAAEFAKENKGGDGNQPDPVRLKKLIAEIDEELKRERRRQEALAFRSPAADALTLPKADEKPPETKTTPLVLPEDDGGSVPNKITRSDVSDSHVAIDPSSGEFHLLEHPLPHEHPPLLGRPEIPFPQGIRPVSPPSAVKGATANPIDIALRLEKTTREILPTLAERTGEHTSIPANKKMNAEGIVTILQLLLAAMAAGIRSKVLTGEPAAEEADWSRLGEEDMARAGEILSAVDAITRAGNDFADYYLEEYNWLRAAVLPSREIEKTPQKPAESPEEKTEPPKDEPDIAAKLTAKTPSETRASWLRSALDALKGVDEYRGWETWLGDNGLLREGAVPTMGQIVEFVAGLLNQIGELLSSEIEDKPSDDFSALFRKRTSAAELDGVFVDEDYYKYAETVWDVINKAFKVSIDLPKLGKELLDEMEQLPNAWRVLDGAVKYRRASDAASISSAAFNSPPASAAGQRRAPLSRSDDNAVEGADSQVLCHLMQGKLRGIF